MSRRPAWKLALPAAAALVSACSLMPTYERPAAPVPQSVGDAMAPASAPATPHAWSQFFTDERLRGLLATALENNRDLRVAVLNIERARAQFDLRFADRLPAVGLSAGASRARGNAGDFDTSFTAGLLVSAWEIDFFGRLASLNEAARAQLLATEHARRAAQVTLVASVATAWLNLVAGEELLSLTQQTLATREESLRLVRLRFDNGASSALELRQAESLAETARVALAQQRRQQALDSNTLGLLLGAPVPAQVVGGARTGSIALPDLPAGVSSDVLVQRPDVRQAEQELVAANASIGAARAAFFPRISLTAGLGTASTELSGLFKGGSWGFSAAPALLQPIFDAGRNRAGLQGARVTREVAVAQYERAIQSAFREVADALAGRSFLADQLAAQRRVAEAEGQRARLSQMRYDAGVASSLDLLDAQRAQFSAAQAEIQVRLARLQNQVALYRALGGGWQDAPAGPSR